ncbi:MAG: hypothetical protein LBK61_04950 [Spirochaetaceae bacterium]|nr:hypothetical protein [Spirochaetaceae bacterium]
MGRELRIRDPSSGRAAEGPCGGENPQGFHPFFRPVPGSLASHPLVWSKEQRHGWQYTGMWRLCFPFGRAMPPHDGILSAGNDAG